MCYLVQLFAQNKESDKQKMRRKYASAPIVWSSTYKCFVVI